MLQNWMIYAAISLVCCFLSVCSAALTCLLLGRWLSAWIQGQIKEALAHTEGLAGRVDALEVYAEGAQKSSDMAARGSAGGQARAENAAEIAQAEKEGKEVILSKLPLEGKKAALLALVAQHPRVAMNVAQKLNRQFGISKFLGMKESEFMQEVAQIAAAALEKMRTEKPAEASAPAVLSPYL